MIKAVFFDINETIVNLSLLENSFGKHFDDKYVLKYWFTKLLHTSTVIGAMNEYKNFAELSEVLLESLFHESGKVLTKTIKAEILGSFKSLPAYDDVPAALQLLRDNGIKTIALSNSSSAMIEEQLANAGIINFFDNYYSVDSVKKYKPFTDIYKYVANNEGLGVDQVAMVACHDWDLFGAKKAGLMTAYIKRKKELFNPYYPKADICSTDLSTLAQEIIALKK